MVTGYAPLGGPGETTVADGYTLLENPTGMSSLTPSSVHGKRAVLSMFQKHAQSQRRFFSPNCNCISLSNIFRGFRVFIKQNSCKTLQSHEKLEKTKN